MDRRNFIKASGAIAGSLIASSALGNTLDLTQSSIKKKRYALVGCGHRGTSMWGQQLVNGGYKDYLDFVGLCDSNPGRLEYAKRVMNIPTCPVYTDFDKMLKETKPDIVMVTTPDSTHHSFIVKALNFGANVITEKPMTTDEFRCQEILDAQKRTGKNVTVTFNYRYSPHRARIWELLRADEIGDITSVDFHWYLDTSHGADYFRRWHGFRAKEGVYSNVQQESGGGSLLLHKASHHFDLLNWWVGSEPEEVFALGGLEFYGKNGKFRGKNCRLCDHKSECNFYWDLTKNQRLMELYAANEHYDGYFRDGCVYRENIDIFDKMALSIKYTNKVQVSYSLTTYSPYEGYRIAFNGTKGRLEAWIKERQPWEEEDGDVLMLTKMFGKRKIIRIMPQGGGHGGGDPLLHARLFKTPDAPDTLKQSAGIREGAMAVLIGIAARNSIDTGKIVKIGDLTSLKPQA
ncbi:MAG: Gfo/Idh/MocA family oxidoreductase [Paludibacter sp.]|jgi:predicted dehydrogenase|nr:Gfo/Idh/MocA family oxidoreductase [Paludibacter sp.]